MSTIERFHCNIKVILLHTKICFTLTQPNKYSNAFLHLLAPLTKNTFTKLKAHIKIVTIMNRKIEHKQRLVSLTFSKHPGVSTMAQCGILHITKTYKKTRNVIPKPPLKQEICTAVMTIAAIQNAIMTNSAKPEQHANLDGKSCRRSSFVAPLAKR